MIRPPRRTLADWTPEAGPVDGWLAWWAEAGWRPEYPSGGTETVVNGQELVRWAMIAPSSGLGAEPGDPTRTTRLSGKR